MTHFEPIPRETERTAAAIVQAGLAVHRTLGPGLLESTYETCLACELDRSGHRVRCQVALPVVYEGIKLEAGYRIDIIVDEQVIVEVKSVDAIAPVHEAQVLTYLKLSERRLGFLINFNVALFKEGIRRFVI